MSRINGSILKSARQKKGLTIRALAELVQKRGIALDHSSIARWENSPMAKPKKESLRVVCEILNIAEEEIYLENLIEDVDVLQIISKIIAISKKNPRDPKIIEIQKIVNSK